MEERGGVSTCRRGGDETSGEGTGGEISSLSCQSAVRGNFNRAGLVCGTTSIVLVGLRGNVRRAGLVCGGMSIVPA